ncbi:hypothetical protein BDN70DRAFT_298907 [Pholiota conissans]|uniref:Uncharacterized protein n=1 Tax=Pholiota conissans TaxID=109636 RepID=A0A9P5YT47_9AGAR|nr:hypothetical protein BDN70DRAFT_298907 [Pholiota conissans]
MKRKANGAVSTPSPAPMQVSTPAATNAPTPTATASSPPASAKSPKTRAPPKAKAAPKGRRPSKAIAPTAVAAAAASSSASTSTPEQVQPAASTSTSTGSTKRQREEDSNTLFGDNIGTPNAGPSAASEPSPPKRVKTEWESPPTEEDLRKQERIDSIKSEEDASQYLLEQMTELIKMTEGDAQNSLTAGISDTLDMILKGYGSVPSSSVDGLDGATMGFLRGSGGDGSGLGLKEESPPPAENFDQFFDFSGMLDEEESKAPTPDLVSSSSTNPSPESNHETDASAHHTFAMGSSGSAEARAEEANAAATAEMLRLGSWKDIDGGEASYFQSNEWKWDSPMLTQEQPWAIYNS